MTAPEMLGNERFKEFGDALLERLVRQPDEQPWRPKQMPEFLGPPPLPAQQSDTRCSIKTVILGPRPGEVIGGLRSLHNLDLEPRVSSGTPIEGFCGE